MGIRRDQGRQPMVSLLSSVEPYRLRAMEFGLGASFRTIVEIRQFYDRMCGLDKKIERLQDVV